MKITTSLIMYSGKITTGDPWRNLKDEQEGFIFIGARDILLGIEAWLNEPGRSHHVLAAINGNRLYYGRAILEYKPDQLHVAGFSMLDALMGRAGTQATFSLADASTIPQAFPNGLPDHCVMEPMALPSARSREPLWDLDPPNVNDALPPPNHHYICQRKKRYLTKEHADYDAKTIATRTGDSVQGYHCSTCHAWHVGTSDNSARWRKSAQVRKARKQESKQRYRFGIADDPWDGE